MFAIRSRNADDKADWLRTNWARAEAERFDACRRLSHSHIEALRYRLQHQRSQAEAKRLADEVKRLEDEVELLEEELDERDDADKSRRDVRSMVSVGLFFGGFGAVVAAAGCLLLVTAGGHFLETLEAIERVPPQVADPLIGTSIGGTIGGGLIALAGQCLGIGAA